LIGTYVGHSANAHHNEQTPRFVRELLKQCGVREAYQGELLLQRRMGAGREAWILTNPTDHDVVETIALPLGSSATDLLNSAIAVVEGQVRLSVKSLDVRALIISKKYPKGRRRAHLHINPELAHLVGVDFGRANLRLMVTNFLGRVLSFQKVSSGSFKGKDQCLQTVCQMIKTCAKKDPSIRAVGISHSGVSDRQEGSVLFGPKVLGWKKVPLKQMIEKACGLPTLVEDSSRTMAQAEKQFGLGSGARDWVHVSLGRGIGSAIFMNGKLC
jgi:hypothetical protein